MKNIKDLKENEVILCKTQEECEVIAELLHMEGMTWAGGGSYLANKHWIPYWSADGFCFYVKYGTWFISFYEIHFTVHNTQDFFPQPQPQDPIKQPITEMIKE